MPRAELPSLARMIADQIPPNGQSDADHEQAVKTFESGVAEAYRCLY
jgi:hypothetical protein